MPHDLARIHDRIKLPGRRRELARPVLADDRRRIGQKLFLDRVVRQRIVHRAAGVLDPHLEVTPDETLAKDQAAATLVAAGETIEVRIEHASGTVENPMSDDAIEQKFLANATPVIGAERARRLAGTVWKLETLSDAGKIVRLCA